ncbi:hypothetical protein [Tellurirhabdus bombi]|uniref:hypothetical protein n=1 Tax=Tellurirhabdus bombi TaxID=2907205 RepID=UPI001F2A6C8F|nr:hypothetical protein [Tellurirhabdus bombi]
MRQIFRLFILLFLTVPLLTEAQVVRLKQLPTSTPPPPGQTDVYYINPKLVGTKPPDQPMPPNHKFLVWRVRTTLPIQTGANGFQYVDFASGWANNQASILQRDVLIRDTYRPDIPITNKPLSGKGASAVLLPLFEKWYLQTEGWFPTFLRNAPPFTPAELAIQKNKVFGGTMPDSKASVTDMRARGWKFTEARSVNGRKLAGNEVFQIPNGSQFKNEFLGGAPYTGPVIYPPHAAPTFEQGVKAANAFSGFNYPIWIDQISEANPEQNAVPVISPGHLGFVSRLKEVYPDRKVYAGYGENVQFQKPNQGRNYLHSDWVHYWEGDPRIQPNGQTDPFFQVRWNNKSFWSAGISFLNQVYPDDPGDPDFFIQTALKLEVKLRQSYAGGQPLRKSILFGWPWLETPGSARWDATEYDLKTSSVIVRRIAGGIPDLIGQEWIALQHTLKGDGLLLWADHHNVVDNPNAIQAPNDPSHARIIPLPGHNAREFKFTNGPARPRFPYIGYDSYFAGYRKAVKVLAHLGTDSPSWAHVAYTLGGKTYTPPANGMGMAHSAYYCRPIVELYSNSRTGKKAIVAVDFFCMPWDSRVITVSIGNGKTINIPMQGNAVHAVLIN